VCASTETEQNGTKYAHNVSGRWICPYILKIRQNYGENQTRKLVHNPFQLEYATEFAKLGALLFFSRKAGTAASIPARRQGPSEASEKRQHCSLPAAVLPKVERPSEGRKPSRKNSKAKPTHLRPPSLCLCLHAHYRSAQRSRASNKEAAAAWRGLWRSLSSSSSRTPIKPLRPFPPIPFLLRSSLPTPRLPLLEASQSSQPG
jgi:hypothetical protein